MEDIRRIRNMGTIDINSVDPIKAVDIETNKEIIFKQFDYGSCIHLNLDFKYIEEPNYKNNEVYATFAINNKIFESKHLIVDISGRLIKAVCTILESGETEILLPKELMVEFGNVSMELVFFDNGIYRMTSQTINFRIEKSITQINYDDIVDPTGNYIIDEEGNHIVWN